MKNGWRHVAALLALLPELGSAQGPECFFEGMDYGGGGECGYADVVGLVSNSAALQPPNWLRGPASVRPSLNSAAACQAECAAFEGCDFFSYEWELQPSGERVHECFLKAGFEEAGNCHEYVPWDGTAQDPQWIGASGPKVCSGGDGWKLMFRQTFPFTFRKAGNGLNHNERDPSAPNYSVLNQLEDFRAPDGFFKFKQTWPRHCDARPGDPTCKTSNVWTQQTNFVTAKASDRVEGFEHIDCPLTCERNPFGGLERTGGESRNQAIADGSGVGTERRSWWYAIGATHAAESTTWYEDGLGIPGPCDDTAAVADPPGAGCRRNGCPEQVVELFVWTGAVARDTSGPECIDGYAKTADWDIDGFDLENHEVDYTSVDDFVSCAGFCTAREDCQAFNFGHPGNGRCWIKGGVPADSDTPTGLAGAETGDWDFFTKQPGSNTCSSSRLEIPPLGGVLCPSFTHYRIKLTNYVQTSCGCGPNHGTGSGVCTPGEMNIDYWCMSELELFDAQLRPIDTSSVVATADSRLCDSTAGTTPEHCENWDPAAVFDGGNQDYCSAAVAPGTRVRDYEGKLGFLAVEFAQPVAVSGFTMGVKGSCTWDMPTAFVFQGSSDGASWQDLADVQGLIWDPSEKKEFRVEACSSESIDDCVMQGYIKTENWDIGGFDLESHAVDWTSDEDLVTCAARCASLPDCEAFNFPHPGNGRCWIKTGLPGNPPDAGAVTSDWAFYVKRPGHTINCAARSNYNDIGCSDGSAEAVFSPTVVGCDASWIEKGIEHGEAACSPGWHICLDADEAEANGLTAESCSNAAAAGTFYGTYESSGGYWNCETDGQNDIWGCGKSGPGFAISNEDASCSVLTKVIGNNDIGDCNDPDVGCWENLGADGGLTELASTRKFPGGGGVMCCLMYEEDIGQGVVSQLLFEEVQDDMAFADVGPDGIVRGGTPTGHGLQLPEQGQVDLGNSPALNPTEAMTVCLWVTVSHDHPGSWHLLATKWDDTAADGQKYAWHFGIQDTTLNLYLSNDGNEYHMAAEAQSLLAEHGLVHTCFTVEAGGPVQIYMNGVPVGAQGTFTGDSLPIVPAHVIIGCKQNGYPSCGDFVVDDFQMWNRALSAAQIYKEVFIDQYEPGWGPLSDAFAGTCSWDSLYTRSDEVLAACCETEQDCPGGIPNSCSIECGQVFVPFYDQCQDLLLEFLEEDIVAFDGVQRACVTQPSDAVFERIRAMSQTGCTFPNQELGTGRRLQGLNFHHSDESDLCPFTDFDDRANRVNDKCCNQRLATSATVGCTSGGPAGVPTTCDVECAMEFIPFMEECSAIIERVLDEEITAFQTLYDTCHAQSVKDMLYAIGDADCFGGWQKLMSDVGYAGTSDSGPLVFDRQGHFTRIAAVRKDGYVSCDCSNNPQCGPGTESCRHTIENCCDNPEGRWNLCAYTDRWPGVDVAAPFELNVNGEQLIVQNAYNEAPVAAGRPCTSEVAMNGAVVCELDIVTALSDTVVLSWNEGRRGQSTGDNCGTLVVDVFGCPEGQECADDFAMHLASGQVAPEYIGCYQSYGWSDSFGNDLVFYLNNARLNPDANDPMVDRCTNECAQRGYDHAALEDGTACMCGHGPPTLPALVGECLPCSDDPSRECGTGMHMSIYRLPSNEIAHAGGGH